MFEGSVDGGTVNAGETSDELLGEFQGAQRRVVLGGKVVKIERLVYFFGSGGGIILQDEIVGVAGFQSQEAQDIFQKGAIILHQHKQCADRQAGDLAGRESPGGIDDGLLMPVRQRGLRDSRGR